MSHYICILGKNSMEEWKFLLFCDRMTASLSTRRLRWIFQYFTGLDVSCIWSERVGFGEERTNEMLTHTYFDRIPPFIRFQKMLFSQFLFTTSVFRLQLIHLFVVVVVVGYYFNIFFAVSLSISIFFAFYFHPHPVIRKVLRTTTQFFGSQTNKQKEDE